MIAAMLFTMLLPPMPPVGPPAPTEQSQETPDVIRDRVAKGMAKAEEKLHEQKVDDETRSIQGRIVKDIEKLIDLFKNPPPQSDSPMSDMQPPDGGPSDGSPNKSRAQSKGSGGIRSPNQQNPSQNRRDQRRARRNEQMTEQGRSASRGQGESDGMAPSPRPDGQPNEGKEGGGKPPEKAGPAPSGGANVMAEVVKDIWGHLPETMRQEVDHYYKDQFMPRYRDLLQQYYSKLSEAKKGDNDKK